MSSSNTRARALAAWPDGDGWAVAYELRTIENGTDRRAGVEVNASGATVEVEVEGMLVRPEINGVVGAGMCRDDGLFERVANRWRYMGPEAALYCIADDEETRLVWVNRREDCLDYTGAIDGRICIDDAQLDFDGRAAAIRVLSDRVPRHEPRLARTSDAGYRAIVGNQVATYDRNLRRTDAPDGSARLSRAIADSGARGVVGLLLVFVAPLVVLVSVRRVQGTPRLQRLAAAVIGQAVGLWLVAGIVERL